MTARNINIEVINQEIHKKLQEAYSIGHLDGEHKVKMEICCMLGFMENSSMTDIECEIERLQQEAKQRHMERRLTDK